MPVNHEILTRTDISFATAVTAINEKAQFLGLDYRFVGGAVADTLLLANHIAFDATNRRVFAFGPEPSTRRADGSVKDFDLITFCPRQAQHTAFAQTVADLRNEFGPIFPQISPEPAIYDTWIQEKNHFSLPQMVSTIEFTDSQPNLVFGSVRQPISPDSLAKWTLVYNTHLEIPMFHPYANMLRYFMRNASGLKYKDHGTKIATLLQIANSSLEQEIKLGNEWEMHALFSPWIQFIDRLLTSDDPMVRLKRDVTKWYWSTIGTALSHGTGPVNLSNLANKFTGR